MSDRRPTLSLGCVPKGLFGMLALVLAIECALARNELEFKHFFTYDWVVTGRLVRQKAPGCKILCFGDSLLKFGVAPSVLQQRLGKRAFNLAVCGGQAPSSYFLLRRALDSGARPDGIVVDFIPHLLARGPRQNNRQWPEFVTVSELIDLSRAMRSAAFLSSLLMARLAPSVQHRFEIRENLLAALNGQNIGLREALLKYERICETHQGALLEPAPPRAPRKYDLSRWEEFPTIWSCHPVNAAYLRRFLELAESRGIPVFWVLPPVSPEAQARREQLGIEKCYLAFVKQMQLEFPNLTIVDVQHSGFDASVFLDPLHLDRYGAAALSAGLADVIAEFRSTTSAGRWVVLPAPRTFAIDIPTGALESSRLAIGTPATEKR